jgi:hypothetical protein
LVGNAFNETEPLKRKDDVKGEVDGKVDGKVRVGVATVVALRVAAKRTRGEFANVDETRNEEESVKLTLRRKEREGEKT